jgi:hypothetical protein
MNYNRENSELYKITKNTKENTNPDTYKQDERILDTHSERNGTETRPQRRPAARKRINPMSMKYVIFISTLWIVFSGAFIAGFIVYYKDAAINASSILWAFAFIVFVLAMIYTILYVKAKRAVSTEDKVRLLRFLPI